MVRQQIGVAVPHAEVALEHVADLAVLLEAAAFDDFREGGQRLAGPLLDVGQLGLSGFVHAGLLHACRGSCTAQAILVGSVI